VGSTENPPNLTSEVIVVYVGERREGSSTDGARIPLLSNQVFILVHRDSIETLEVRVALDPTPLFWVVLAPLTVASTDLLWVFDSVGTSSRSHTDEAIGLVRPGVRFAALRADTSELAH